LAKRPSRSSTGLVARRDGQVARATRRGSDWKRKHPIAAFSRVTPRIFKIRAVTKTAFRQNAKEAAFMRKGKILSVQNNFHKMPRTGCKTAEPG
jgi:hypothetical protein